MSELEAPPKVPLSYTGRPRYIATRKQDTLGLVYEFRKLSFFNTSIYNPV